MELFITKPTQRLNGFKCDKCGKEDLQYKDTEDGQYTYTNYAWQEYMHIQYNAGYGSKYWGDMTSIKLDLCEKCHFDLFKDILNKKLVGGKNNV